MSSVNLVSLNEKSRTITLCYMVYMGNSDELPAGANTPKPKFQEVLPNHANRYALFTKNAACRRDSS